MAAFDVVANLRANDNNMIGMFTTANVAVTNLSRGIGTLPKVAALAGAGVAIGIAAIGSAVADAVGKAVDFEEAFVGVRKTVEGTDEEFDAIHDSLLSMSPQLGIANTKLADLAATAGQMGVPASQVAEFTRTLAELEIATDIIGQEGALNMGRFLSVMGKSGEDAAENAQHVADVLVHLGNNAAAMESEILGASTALGEYSAIAGVSVDDTLAFATALVEAGEAPAGIASGIGRSFTEINTAVLGSTEELQGFAEIAGQTADEFSRKWRDDAGGAFLDFLEGLSEVEDKATVLEDLGLGDVRQIRTISLLAENIDRTREVVDATAESSGKAQVEVDKFLDSTAAKARIARESINTIKTVLGEVILAEIKPFIDDLADAATAAADAAANGADFQEVLSAMADENELGADIADGIWRAVKALEAAKDIGLVAVGGMMAFYGATQLVAVALAGLVATAEYAIAGIITGFGHLVNGVEWVLKAMNKIPGVNLDGAIDSVNNFSNSVFELGNDIREHAIRTYERIPEASERAGRAVAGGFALMGDSAMGFVGNLNETIDGFEPTVAIGVDDAEARAQILGFQTAADVATAFRTAVVAADVETAAKLFKGMGATADQETALRTAIAEGNTLDALAKFHDLENQANHAARDRTVRFDADLAPLIVKVRKLAHTPIIGQAYTAALAQLEGRQHGGRTRPGVPYIVGETQPEVFVPDTAGTVLPSVPMGGGGTVVYNYVTVNNAGSVITERDLTRTVHTGLARTNQRTSTLGLN